MELGNHHHIQLQNIFITPRRNAVPISIWNPATWDSIDGPWEHYPKHNTPDKEQQILYGITYIWNQKKRRRRKADFIETN